MQLSELTIRRPVFATVLSLLIVLIGLVSFNRLAVREYPKIDVPVVTISVAYKGAAAETVESEIVQVLEDAVAAIDGIDTISSLARAEQAQITVSFTLEKDADSAAAEVRDRVARVLGRLPADSSDPVISKVDADAQPVIWLAFRSANHTALEVSSLVNEHAKPRLARVTGAAQVNLYGERKYSMRIWIDADKLAAYRLTVQDVEDAIRRNNLEVPAGRIESAQREFSVITNTTLATVREFRDIVVRQVGAFPVTLGMLARVEEAAENLRTNVRINGQNAVAIGVIRQATANPLKLSEEVRALMPSLLNDLPAGFSVEVTNDNSLFIDRSIKNVYTTLAEATVLVALVIFVFLRSLRAAIIPLTTIPVSLIGTFYFLSLAGFSINTLTLLAFVLAIGLVVDDAIVVLENIYRHIEEGMAPFAAAIKGVHEISFAVIAMTLTLVAVYAPLAFTPGRTGRLFAEFALTLAGAVLFSGFVALTLTPMMCSKILQHRHKSNAFDSFVGKFLARIEARYAVALKFFLRARWLVIFLLFLVLAAIALVLPNLKRELAPLEDRGVILLTMTAPEGATLDFSEKYVAELEKIGSQYPEFDRVFSILGNPTVSQASIFLRGKPWEERSRTTLEIAPEIQRKLGGISGVSAFPITPPSLGQGFRSRPVNFIITTSESYEALARVAQDFLTALASNPSFIGVDINLRLNKPELIVSIDRARAADMGVSIDTIARTIESMLGGRTVTTYKKDATQYNVIVQTDASRRNVPADIARLFVRGRADAMLPLSSFVRVRESVSPRELNHFGQRRAVTLTANLSPNLALGDALDQLKATAKQVLPPGYNTDFGGSSREFLQSSDSLMAVWALALLFIFLIMAIQFESFIDPFIIMLSVPLSMVGALLAIKFSNSSLNVYSQIGLITLVGLITKHGILIVEFANQLQEKGSTVHEAVLHAAIQRLRPILMTTGAMILGAIPLVLANGAGAESRIQIGWTIVGGMFVGTLLTIFVVPTMYTLLSRAQVSGQLAQEKA